MAASSAQVPLYLVAASGGLSLVQRTKWVRPSVPEPSPGHGFIILSFTKAQGCFGFLCTQGTLTCCVFSIVSPARAIAWSRASSSGEWLNGLPCICVPALGLQAGAQPPQPQAAWLNQPAPHSVMAVGSLSVCTGMTTTPGLAPRALLWSAILRASPGQLAKIQTAVRRPPSHLPPQLPNRTPVCCAAGLCASEARPPRCPISWLHSAPPCCSPATAYPHLVFGVLHDTSITSSYSLPVTRVNTGHFSATC